MQLNQYRGDMIKFLGSGNDTSSRVLYRLQTTYHMLREAIQEEIEKAINVLEELIESSNKGDREKKEASRDLEEEKS